jgi:predicted PolB exonuclease-like 3'-5' exonuclease
MILANTWVIDIETSPLIVMVWELGKQYVSKEQLITDWHIMMFRAKKLGAPVNSMIKMEARDGDDTALLKKLWEIFNEADVIISQNGKKFDEPKIKARMMIKGFKPYKPFKHHDTFEQNSDKEFTSHSLDYLTDKFCTKYKKLKHKLFSGLSLWKACLGIHVTLKPNPKAWVEMGKYCDYDVLSDEELFLNTRGWSKNSAPVMVFENDITRQCKYCGKYKLKIDGKKHKGLKVFNYMQCLACGKYQLGVEVKEKEAA